MSKRSKKFKRWCRRHHVVVEQWRDKYGTVNRTTWMKWGIFQQTEWPSKRGLRYIRKHGVATPADRVVAELTGEDV